MANNYFQFKQFTVQQDTCAMKVCTDACIFGAYVAKRIRSGQLSGTQILDIGAGTGLLSLLLAQKTNAIIDAIEIDAAAFVQASQNFEQSPWNNRLTIFNEDALKFYSEKKYDCIISNPPFFEDDLKSDDDKKNAAKHNTTLTLQQLLTVTNKYLSPQGFFAVLLPYHRCSFFTEMANATHYFLNEQLLIQHTLIHPFFRVILFFSRFEKKSIRNELVIKKDGQHYTPEFIDLLEDYYLDKGLR